ncbi:hypothetical protein C8A05DRAFT_38238 [Staphylotrichum tortipilum]|uniref:Uncharacterized protein n=1 Tax=Staphylotrichum tortipilum TaxID=2831512 RepID=A0AAN6MDQ6_9PEZI|nr:hypothetical protein C8A05DRAFT_38238 [Staphylotrichum longicolle]
MGAAAPEVANYFCGRIFSNPESSDILKRSNRQPMAEHAVPGRGSNFKVSAPVLDILYGYNRQAAFLPEYHPQLFALGTEMEREHVDSDQSLPGGGGVGGGLGSASCVNLAESLNHQLSHGEMDKTGVVDNVVFSVAMNGLAAQLYVSWKTDELKYCMANVNSFLLQDPEHYIEFRKMVSTYSTGARKGTFRGDNLKPATAEYQAVAKGLLAS